MRVKQITQHLPLRKLELMYQRLTFSRLTTAYLVFSIVHCTIQVGLQSRAFTINADAATFLYSISLQGNATDNRVPALGNGDLRLCPDVPTDAKSLDACQVIWNGTAESNRLGADNSTDADLESALDSLLTTVTMSPAVTTIIEIAEDQKSKFTSRSDEDEDEDEDDEDDEDDDDDNLAKRNFKVLAFVEDGKTRINITGDGYDNTPATLSTSCLWSLNWPVSILDNTKREDIVFIAFQFWVLGMSIVALLNESIPHIFASLLTHLMATAWSAFQISHTASFRATFNRVITKGACNGISLLPNYWEQRAKAEYPTLALNIVALFFSAWFTWRLVKLFGWQTFKRVGASLTINRVYKLVLVLSINLQISFFFMAITVSLWLDNLFNGVAAEVAWYVTLYKAVSFGTLVLLIPWIATGWYAVRQEKRIPMFIFLVLSILYLSGWSVMFLSTTFRWTFITWRFFSIMASASVLLTLVAFVIGVVCRYNFGKGLNRYLNAQEPLPGDDFAPVYSSDMEKVEFPSNEKPIPTYSAAFGSGAEVPPPSQMFASQPKLGPRFFDSSAEPFETPRNLSPVTMPPSALTRASSKASSNDSFGSISRSNTRLSDQSVSGIASYYTYSSSDGHSPQGHSQSPSQDMRMGGKRWVIE